MNPFPRRGFRDYAAQYRKLKSPNGVLIDGFFDLIRPCRMIDPVSENVAAVRFRRGPRMAVMETRLERGVALAAPAYLANLVSPTRSGYAGLTIFILRRSDSDAQPFRMAA